MTATSSGSDAGADALAAAAIEHTIAGRLLDALDAFGEALALAPHHARALHGLGVIALRFSRIERAVELLERAAQAGDVQLTDQPHTRAKLYADLGDAYEASARLPEAIEAWGLALRAAPEEPVRAARERAIDALLEAADGYREEGSDAAAARLYQMVAIARPSSARASASLGALYLEHANPREAEVPLREAVRRENRSEDVVQLADCLARLDRPADVIALLEPLRMRRGKNLAIRLALADALLAVDRAPEAERILRRSLAGRPQDPAILRRLGTVAAARGRFDESEALLDRASAHDPGAAPRLALAALYVSIGRDQDAARLYDALARGAPEMAEVHHGRARLLVAHGFSDAARRSWDRALDLEPQHLEAALGRTEALADAGDDETAQSRAREAMRRHAGSGIVRYRRAVLVPRRPIGAAATRAAFDALREGLDALASDPPTWILASCRHLPATGGALLAAPDPAAARAAAERLAAIVRAACPTVSYVAPHTARRPRGARIRVVFCGASLGAGGRWRHHVSLMDRRRFEVLVARPPAALVSVGEPEIDALADGTTRLPASVGGALAVLAALEADVIVYPTLGRDPLPGILGHARLARLQCASWDHPVTSGLASIDAYLSSALAEPEDADVHYAEPLVRLPGLPGVPPIEATPSPSDRRALGLPARGPLWVCPQGVAALAGPFDETLVALLRAETAGRVALPASPHPELRHRVSAHFEAIAPDVTARMHWLEDLDADGLRGLIAAADAVLDPIGAGGCTAAFGALAAAVPVVTLAGGDLRSRRARALYAAAGAPALGDLVATDAESYLRIALRLARDRDYRDERSRAIVESRDRLFDPAQAVRAFESFCEDALRQRS